jgi:hypothetical protein
MEPHRNLDLFDYKPKLQEMFGQDLPASIRGTQRLTGMTAVRKNSRSLELHSNLISTVQTRQWMSEFCLTRQRWRMICV